MMNMFSENNAGSRVNPLIALLGVVLFFIALFYLAKTAFFILSWIAPVLFILTLFINHKVVLDYGKTLIKWTKQSPVIGIVAIVLSFMAFPFVSAFLFGKAMLLRKVNAIKKDIKQKEEGVYTEYEDLTEDEMDDPLDLRDIEVITETKGDKVDQDTNDYDDLFK